MDQSPVLQSKPFALNSFYVVKAKSRGVCHGIFPAPDTPCYQTAVAVPVTPVPSSRILLCPAAWIPPPSLKVVRLLLCDVLACSGLMIPSRFASSAHFLCLLLLCVPRSLMQMSGRIFFEAETQGTVWVSPSQCDTAPFSWSNYHSPFRQLFTKFTFHMPVTSSSAFAHNLLSWP